MKNHSFLARNESANLLPLRHRLTAPSTGQTRNPLRHRPGPNDELPTISAPFAATCSMGDIIEQRNSSRSSNSNPQIFSASISNSRPRATHLHRPQCGNPATFFRQAQSLIQVDENTKFYTKGRLNDYSGTLPLGASLAFSTPPQINVPDS